MKVLITRAASLVNENNCLELLLPFLNGDVDASEFRRSLLLPVDFGDISDSLVEKFTNSSETMIRPLGALGHFQFNSTNLIELLETYLENELGCDYEFVVDNHVIKLHRWILSSCPFFKQHPNFLEIISPHVPYQTLEYV